MQVTTSRKLVLSLLYEAKGAREVDYSRGCVNPPVLELTGRPDVVTVGLGIEKLAPLFVDLQVPCRKCPVCLEHRRRLWTARGIDEVRASSRTWFGTLTIAPETRFRCGLIARSEAATRGKDYGLLSASEQFKAIERVTSREVTLWLKRVRKNSKAKFRYLLVSEAHKDGFPHYHVLVQEHGSEVSKRVLETAWRYGFSQFRLVDGEGPVGYVSKYLAKSALTRVRASQRYGQAAKRLLAERVIEATMTLLKARSCPHVPVKQDV